MSARLDRREQMPHGCAHWLIACFGLLCAAASLSMAASQQSKIKTPAKSPVGDPALIDQQGFRELLQRSRGKPLLLNFWATWCQPCHTEYPMINELALAHSVSPKWNGTIPATFFYARDGRQVGMLIGEHSREDFEKAIRALLDSSPARGAEPRSPDR